ncbi:MAG TPA: hypothetical protein VLW83_13855, partial [Candidatus Acidoferrales bacterium]|nr:hypothetical protein [Candidatus Acidoferrales bacterium]
SVHQMAGIEVETVRETYGVPAEFEPVTGMAIGYPGDPDSLPEDLRKRELAPRTRKPFEKFIFSHIWNQSSRLLSDS